ncbi:MAG: alpha/beta hydrolase [Gemmatimonas sp.]|uniref:alpha/beta hydrolase n=1 Tax=Gemmatimonas sp. TaxID=1962908 RepID=UPI00391F7123
MPMTPAMSPTPVRSPSAPGRLRVRFAALGVAAVVALGCDAGVLSGPVTQVPDPSSENTSWVTPAVSAPGVEHRVFSSQTARTAVSYHLYRPPQYDAEPTRRFPVVYWLHGSGGGLGGIAPLAAHFDAAIRAGRIPPLLVVFANGMTSSMWANSKDGRIPMETVVAQDLVNELDTRFRTVATRDGRILEGFSMGGHGAARIGLRYPERFGAVSMLGAGPLDRDFAGPRALANPAERARIMRDVYGDDLAYYREHSPLTVAEAFARGSGARPRLRIVVGDADNTAPGSAAFSTLLGALGVAHEYRLLPGVGHDTMALFAALGERVWAFYRPE